MQLVAASVLHVNVWLNVHRSLECWYVSCADCSIVVWYVCGHRADVQLYVLWST